jgi:hypothetical protein
VIVVATGVAVVVATVYWRPLRWPAYALAAWLCLLLMAWPLSATGNLWKHIRVGWYIVFVLLTIVVIACFFAFGLSMLIRAARAAVRRLR